MATYITRRLLLMIPTFLAITILVYSLCRIVPGGPIEKAQDRAMMQAMEEGSRGTATYNDDMHKMQTNCT